MDTNTPVEDLVEAKQELLEELEILCKRRDELYGDCEVSEAVKALRSELEDLQATRETLTEEIQTARATRLAGVQDREIPEIARLTAERVGLRDEITATQEEIRQLDTRRAELACDVIAAENALAAATDKQAAAKREFEEWRSEELQALHKQRNEIAARHSVHTKEIAAIQEGREAIKLAESGIAARTDQLLIDKAKLEAEQDASAQDREHCTAIKVANDKRQAELYDKEREITDREWALSDRAQTLTDCQSAIADREAKLSKRETDLIENWRVWEKTGGQSAAG